jgi:hypothetical protein
MKITWIWELVVVQDFDVSLIDEDAVAGLADSLAYGVVINVRLNSFCGRRECHVDSSGDSKDEEC